MSTDLDRLPAPQIVESLDFETILTEIKADFIERYPAFSGGLESDPAIKLMESFAYRELLLRQRINEAARANLLAFSAGTDLDHLAAFYGVERLEGESDDALRTRVRERIVGWSTAGGAAHYRYWALSADSTVQDAAVSSPEPGRVRIAILSTVGDGTASPALISQVEDVVLAEDVRVLTDAVEVVPVEIEPVDVAVRIWLRPGTPTDVVDALRGAFSADFDRARGLGVDITRSWLYAYFHADGVHRVEIDAPTSDVVITDSQCAAVGAVTVTMQGYDL